MPDKRPMLDGEVKETEVWNVRAYCAYDSTRRVCFDHMDNAAKAFGVPRTYVYARRNTAMMLAGWFVHSYDKRNNTFLTYSEARLQKKLPPPPFCDMDNKGTPRLYREYYETTTAAFAAAESHRKSEKAKKEALQPPKTVKLFKHKKIPAASTQERPVSSPVRTGDVTVSAIVSSSEKVENSSANSATAPALGRGSRRRKVTPPSHFGDDYDVRSTFARPTPPSDGDRSNKKRRLSGKHKGNHDEAWTDRKYSIRDLLPSHISSGLTPRDTPLAGFSKEQIEQLKRLNMLAAPQCEAAQWRARNAHYTSAYRHVMDPFYHLSDEERRRYHSIILADVEVVRSESGDNSAVVVGMTSPGREGRAPTGEDRSGRTPLHRAVAVSDYAKVRRLLDANADVTARDICGCTALHEATEAPMMELLLAAGADPSASPFVSQTEGDTPLHQAAKSDDSTRMELLLLAGADGDKCNKQSQTVRDVASSAKAKALLQQASGCLMGSRLLSPDAAVVRDPVVDVTQTWKYSCEICGKKFKGQGPLKNHLKKHAADRDRELARQLQAK